MFREEAIKNGTIRGTSTLKGGPMRRGRKMKVMKTERKKGEVESNTKKRRTIKMAKRVNETGRTRRDQNEFFFP